MNRFAIAMRTARRETSYLGSTLDNLVRAGLLRTQIDWNMVVCDSHGDGADDVARLRVGAALDRVKYWNTGQIPGVGEIPNLNAAAALSQASATGMGWVLFLEDDIDVCDDFMESVDAWIRDVANPKYRVYPLCAAYSGVRECQVPGWRYPVEKFYGTQAFLIRQQDAMCLSDWVVARQPAWGSPKGFDMMLKAWHKEKYPTLECFLAAAPNFIQHTGEVSTMNPGRYFSYVSFPGREWSYYRKRSGNSIWGRAERTKPRTSPMLASALRSVLHKGKPVFDFGCGEGFYLAQLAGNGFVTHGFEGTPGIGGCNQTVVDITDPMPNADQVIPGWTHAAKGSVLCIEVAEHIPHNLEGRLLDNLNRYCDDLLVLSWAVPGQGGKRHINERDAKHVVDTVSRYGFALYDDATSRLRDAGGHDLKWLKQSLYVFRRVL